MSVSIDGVPIANYTIVIVRGGVLQVPVSFFDDAGDPEALLSAEIVITPSGAAVESWTQANGRFINIGVGEYEIVLTEAYTTAITWSAGTYRLQVVDSSGFTNPCVIDGLIFAKDC